MRRNLAVPLLALLATGCSLAPKYYRPSVGAPPAWREPSPGEGSLADLAWWDLFGDPALQELIRIALAESQDIQLAVARIAEARARLGIVRSVQFPQVDAEASVARARFSDRSFPPLPLTADLDQTLYTTSLDLAFELDLWGRLRNATAAARAELLATEEARRTVMITLVSDVAQAYFDLRKLDLAREIALRTRESRGEAVRIVRLRAEHGVASALDVAQAEVQLESATAAVPDFERQVAQTENRLSVLLGRAPGPIVRGRPLTAQPLPPAVPAGLPSDLLERRPDLREAEAQLIATYARVGEAKAALFPRIALTGAFGFESTSLSDFFTWPASMWQIGPSIRVPVFNAGRLRSGVDAAEALQAEALSQYRQAVLQAFGEVEDALVAYEKAGVARAAQERQVVAAQRALLIAQQRYLNGLSSFLDVLDGQRELFVAELALAQTRRDQLVAVVRVYKALGGGWSPSTEPTP